MVLTVHISQHWGTDHAVCGWTLHPGTRNGGGRGAEKPHQETLGHREGQREVHEESHEGLYRLQ